MIHTGRNNDKFVDCHIGGHLEFSGEGMFLSFVNSNIRDPTS